MSSSEEVKTVQLKQLSPQSDNLVRLNRLNFRSYTRVDPQPPQARSLNTHSFGAAHVTNRLPIRKFCVKLPSSRMNLAPFKVLLVDDEESYRLLIRELLYATESARYDLDWVQNYDAGLAAMKLNQHDVYLVDYRLGDRNGLELLREAMEQARYTEHIQSPLLRQKHHS